MITIANSSINSSLFLWAKNKIWYHIQSDALWATFDSYFVEIAITYFGLPTFKQQQSPAQNGSIFFDVQEAVTSLIEYQFSYSMELPPPLQNSIFPNVPYNFELTFTEYQDGIATNTINSSFKAILAGLDNDNFTYQNQNKWIFEDWKFLTSSPTKPASPDVPDFLRHFNTYNTVTNIDINVRLLYDDGTSNDFVAYSNYATDQKFYTIPTGYQALNIASNLLPNKTLRFFAVWVSKVGDKTYRLSEVMTYEMFAQPELEKKAFLYRNSLGAYETFFCTGQILEQMQSKKTALKKLYPSGVVGYQYTFDNHFVNEQNGKRTLTVATGWLSKDFAESLQDAAISHKVWLIDYNVEQKLVPVIIENISAVYYEKNNELIGYVFTASYAYDIDLYTKNIVRENYGLPIAPPPPLDAAGFRVDRTKNIVLNLVNNALSFTSTNISVSIFFKQGLTFWNDPNFSLSNIAIICTLGSNIIYIYDFLGSQAITYTLSSAILPNAMYHLVLTRQGNTEKLYFDNQLIATNIKSSIANNLFNVRIGYTQIGGDAVQEIFDIKTYPRVLSDSEINDIFTSFGDISPANPFVDIPLNEIEGSYFADISGNNNNMSSFIFGYDPIYHTLGPNNYHIDINSNSILP